mmetsp:Transcript_14531/g.40385  ORF Transcript_14531/g.40385 Transcript_14531/m.40385 type:complete len:270 (-) Transcript_14531:256-1065(-)
MGPGPFQCHRRAGCRAEGRGDGVDPRERDGSVIVVVVVVVARSIVGFLKARGALGLGGHDLGGSQLPPGTSLQDAAEESPAADGYHDGARFAESLGLELGGDFVDEGAVARPQERVVVGTDVAGGGIGFHPFSRELVRGVPVDAVDGDVGPEAFQLGNDEGLGRFRDNDRDVEAQETADGGHGQSGVPAAGTDDFRGSLLSEGRAQMGHAAVLERPGGLQGIQFEIDGLSHQSREGLGSDQRRYGKERLGSLGQIRRGSRGRRRRRRRR